MAGFIENWGRGYEKIKNAFEQESLQVPTFEQVRGGVLATIQRERFVALNKQSGGNDGDVSVMELTERQSKLLDLIKAYPTVSVAQMAVMMSVKKRTVERELAVLRKKGIIAREGSPRTGRWIVK
ncbi:MAG: hypothetical protein IJP44_09575 [Bacteroidales bacterium]|nr:hypothetical protein [Bacteroidales bacterium]